MALNERKRLSDGEKEALKASADTLKEVLNGVL